MPTSLFPSDVPIFPSPDSEIHEEPAGCRFTNTLPFVITTLESFRDWLESTLARHPGTPAHRFLIHTFCPRELVFPAIDLAGRHNFSLEASITLPFPAEEYCFLYLGRNSAGRQTTTETVGAQRGALETILNGTPYATWRQPLAVIGQQGCTVERLGENTSAADEARLLAMFRRCYTSHHSDLETFVAELLSGREGVGILAARSVATGELQACCGWHETSVPLPNGRLFKLWEVGCSVRASDGAAGLNAPLKVLVCQRAEAARVDLAFCETRSAMIAVNKINFALGMRYCGFLPKHSIVNGPQDIPERELDDSPYSNMHVWALASPDIAARLKTI